MKALAALLFFTISFFSFAAPARAQSNISQGGTGTTTLPAGSFWVGKDAAIRAVNTGTFMVFDYATKVLTLVNAPILSSLTSALVITNGSGQTAEYTGTSCTNQFPRSLSALGAATCAAVNLASDITGTLGLTNGGTGSSLSDPNADRILFWDDSNGVVDWLTAGTGLTITGTTISATGGSSDGIGTTSPWTANNLVVVNDDESVRSIGTSTPVIGNGLSYSGTIGDLVGGASGTLTATLGTTIAWNEFVGQPYTAGNLFYAAGANAIEDVATTTLSISGTGLSLSANPVVIGAAPITLSLTTVGLANGGTATTTAYDTGLWFYDSSLGTFSQASRANSNHNLVWDRTTPGLGIGTTTPWGLLSVNANALGAGVPQFVVGSSTATNFIVSNSGRVGIGTTSPSANYTFGITGTAYASGGLTLGTPLTVANGGSGAATLTGVLKGNGTSAFTAGVDGTDFTLVNAVSCTNQVMTALTAAGAGTCSSINNAFWSGTDLSVANGGTGLSTFGGTNHILYTTAADTLASEAAFTYAPSTDLFTAVNATTTNLSAATNLYIPIAANPTISANGDTAIDSTTASSSLKYYDGAAERVIYSTGYMILPYASTTAAAYGSNNAATTTVRLGTDIRPATLVSAYCKTDTGTFFYRFGDGTNWTETATCNSTGVLTTFSSNATFIMNEEKQIQYGTQASNPNTYPITLNLRRDAD